MQENKGKALSEYASFTLIPWGPFLESPVNLTGPQSNIQIEI